MEMKRNCGLDLLRIIAMAMIVLRHGVYQSGVTSSPAATVLNRTIGVFVNDFTAVAVNCFVLITGYFLSKQEFRLKRLASIWLMVLFYSVGLFLCSAFLSSPAPLTFSGALRALTPICSDTYWFVTLYFLIVLVSPLLNSAIAAVQGRSAVPWIALIAMFSVLPTFGVDLVRAADGYSFGWFAVLYLTGAWLRERATLSRWSLPAYLALFALTLGYHLVRKSLKSRGVELISPDGYNFLTNYLASVFLFLFFASLEIRREGVRRTIAFFSPLMIGVYLFHDHYLKHELWRDLLGINAFLDTPAWLYQVPPRIAAVFAAGCAVEWVRRRLFGRVFALPLLSRWKPQT
jgi:surface polysaccharide O-acyltransferase-like enzyme